MDTTNVVEKIRITLKEFVSKKGEFSLVMLIPTEASVIDSNVTLLVSAPWLDKKSPKQAIDLIVQGLRKHLSMAEFPYITRVTVVHSSDSSVKAINSAFIVKEGRVDIMNYNLFGTQIERATLLESHRLQGSKKRLAVSIALK